MLRKAVTLALGLSAVASFPLAATAADRGCTSVRLRCSGFEPNWAFRLTSNGQIRFTDPDNTNGGVPPVVIPACATHLGGNQIGITAGAPLGLSATVTHQSCVEPSGSTAPYSISISYTQGAVGGTPRQASGTGCCRRY